MDEEAVIPEPAPTSQEQPNPDIAEAEGKMIICAQVASYGVA